MTDQPTAPTNFICHVNPTDAQQDFDAASTQTRHEVQMFGCTQAEIETLVAEQIAGIPMVAMSLLSDAQEMMGHGETERARTHINIVKYIINKHLTERTTSEAPSTAQNGEE